MSAESASKLVVLSDCYTRQEAEHLIRSLLRGCSKENEYACLFSEGSVLRVNLVGLTLVSGCNDRQKTYVRFSNIRSAEICDISQRGTRPAVLNLVCFEGFEVRKAGYFAFLDCLMEVKRDRIIFKSHAATRIERFDEGRKRFLPEEAIQILSSDEEDPPLKTLTPSPSSPPYSGVSVTV